MASHANCKEQLHSCTWLCSHEPTVVCVSTGIAGVVFFFLCSSIFLWHHLCLSHLFIVFTLPAEQEQINVSDNQSRASFNLCSEIFFFFTRLNKCVPALLLHQGRWAPVDIYSRFITFMLPLYNLTGTTPSHASSAALDVAGWCRPSWAFSANVPFPPRALSVCLSLPDSLHMRLHVNNIISETLGRLWNCVGEKKWRTWIYKCRRDPGVCKCTFMWRWFKSRHFSNKLF